MPEAEDRGGIHPAVTRSHLYQLLIIPALVGVSVTFAVFDIGFLADEMDLRPVALAWALPLIALSMWLAWLFDKKKVNGSRTRSVAVHLALNLGVAVFAYLFGSWVLERYGP